MRNDDNEMARTKPSQQFGLIEIDESRRRRRGKAGGQGVGVGIQKERQAMRLGICKYDKVARIVGNTD